MMGSMKLSVRIESITRLLKKSGKSAQPFQEFVSQV